MAIKTIQEYLLKMDSDKHRETFDRLLTHIARSFPQLEPRIAWNTPMFTDHGTFILGLSHAKGHIAISPEAAGMRQFADDIAKAGYSSGKMLFRIRWDQEIDFDLIDRLIVFNIADKKDCSTFWRKV